ncbi:MAG: hypothetical protein JNK90_08375 [Planctomycetaceae bacterium]|nr:hypothetical protein [Planctomycetaceae bacterium]
MALIKRNSAVRWLKRLTTDEKPFTAAYALRDGNVRDYRCTAYGHVLTIIPWTIVVAIACHRESKRGRGAIACATYVFVTVFIIIAAYLAPVKTTDRMLNNPLVLPNTELTLVEMDRKSNFECTQWLPRNIYIVSTSENAGRWIQFRTNEITIREFVDAIESLSDLRHRFVHCGNGSSILFGGDCCFGLRLR